MKKVLRSINSYKSITKEDFKLVVSIQLEDIDDTSKLAVLTPYIEFLFSYGDTIVPVTTEKSYKAVYTKDEIKAIRNNVTVPKDSDMYDTVNIVELETAKSIIEAKGLFEINGILLKSSDFEIVDIAGIF